MVEKAMWGALFGIAVLALMFTLALAVVEVATHAGRGLASAMEWVRKEFG